MDNNTLIILIIIGLSAGLLGGITGLGGGIIIIPALIYFLKLEQHAAQGISIAVMLPPIGILAAYTYYKGGYVNIKYSAIIAVCFIIGAFFGSKIAINISANNLHKVFGVIFLIVALKMIFSK
ncbi:MAG: permease [Bacteroidetes bacterium GWE2_29_8]|nr:MAG: permease [Bacteroidetes bacterium GWE2_29_8]OFY24485.1 MAG: permease [Bacteroidetes bacterium GWF2_29_10]